jgi:uncharacterized protein YlxW (UPF0749 family)
MSDHENKQDLPTAGRRPPADVTPFLGTGEAPDPEKTLVPETVEYVRPAPGAALAPVPAEEAAEPPRLEDEQTTRLGRPEAPEDDLDGPTRRLDPPATSPEGMTPEAGPAKPAPWRRVSTAGALIGVLLALFGFTLVVQLRSNDGDQGLATARQEDLVRILSDLEARDSRLQSEISALETSQRQLTSGVAGRQAALAEAEKRADELGLLAGTLPGRGPGLLITMDKVKASAILNAVQELRGAGGEVMQLTGTNGQTVRIVASSYFVDAEGGGIIADGGRLTGPYLLSVIGQPQTMQTALQIPGGVVASVNSGGGSVTMEQRPTVEVTAVRQATTLQYARPAS